MMTLSIVTLNHTKENDIEHNDIQNKGTQLNSNTGGTLNRNNVILILAIYQIYCVY
jgi:hypothetical protein